MPVGDYWGASRCAYWHARSAYWNAIFSAPYKMLLLLFGCGSGPSVRLSVGLTACMSVFPPACCCGTATSKSTIIISSSTRSCIDAGIYRYIYICICSAPGTSPVAVQNVDTVVLVLGSAMARTVVGRYGRYVTRGDLYVLSVPPKACG